MKLLALFAAGALALRPHTGQVHSTAELSQVVDKPPTVPGTPTADQPFPENPVFAEAPKISVAVKCIMSLCMQYFVILAAVAVLKSIKDYQQTEPGPALIALQVSRGTLLFAPMLAVMCLAIRYRAVWLSRGSERALFDLPQGYVKLAMSGATFVLGFQALLVLVQPCLGKTPAVDEDGNIKIDSDADDGSWTMKIISWMRLFCLVILWICVTAMIVGVNTMEAPPELWPNGTPTVAPAVQVTMWMTSLYFIIYACAALLREFHGDVNLVGCFTVAMNCVQLAPMMCVLFISARMRSNTLGRPGANPQSWAMTAMFVCGVAMILQVIVVVSCGLTGNECQRGVCEMDVKIKMTNTSLQGAMDGARIVCLAVIYGCILTVLYSLMVVTAPGGPSQTPPLAPAIRCVSVLTQLYFFIYLVLYCTCMYREWAESESTSWFIQVFETARGAVQLAPMVGVLVLGVRLRAMQLGRDPQGWAQECMFLATHAVIIQTFLCIGIGCCTAHEVTTDDDGHVKTPETMHSGLQVVLEATRYACLIMMYGGVIGVINSAATITIKEKKSDERLFSSFKIPQPINPFAVFSVAGLVDDQTE